MSDPDLKAAEFDPSNITPLTAERAEAILTAMLVADAKKINIERARHLMDPQLLRDAERDLIKSICPNGFNPFDIAMAERMSCGPNWKANQVWRVYCHLHEKKYGEPFAPDVDPNYWAE